MNQPVKLKPWEKRPLDGPAPKFRVFRHIVKRWQDIEKTKPTNPRYDFKLHEIVYDNRKKTKILGWFVVPANIVVLSETMDIKNLSGFNDQVNDIMTALTMPVLDFINGEEVIMENENDQGKENS